MVQGEWMEMAEGDCWTEASNTEQLLIGIIITVAIDVRRGVLNKRRSIIIIIIAGISTGEETARKKKIVGLWTQPLKRLYLLLDRHLHKREG